VTRALTICLFALAGAACLALQAWSRRDGTRLPGLGTVLGAVLDLRVGRLPVGRLVLYAAWWWLGWHVFAR
jgi:Family of unknown function (DUF6186)